MVIFGGRNDSCGQAYLNDIWLLELERLTWIRWDNRDSMGTVPEGRYTHCSAVIGNSLFIFGGLGEGNYCKGVVFSFDFDGNVEEKPKEKKPVRKFVELVKSIASSETVAGNEAEGEEEDALLPLITQQHEGLRKCDKNLAEEANVHQKKTPPM